MRLKQWKAINLFPINNSGLIHNQELLKEMDFSTIHPYNDFSTKETPIISQRSKSREYDFAPYRIKLRRNFKTPIKCTYSGFLKPKKNPLSDYSKMKETFYNEKKENEKYVTRNVII